MSEPVVLGVVQETLLIPLYGRAMDAGRSPSVLGDRRATQLVAAIDYDFAKFRGPSSPSEKTQPVPILAGPAPRCPLLGRGEGPTLSQHKTQLFELSRVPAGPLLARRDSCKPC